MSRALNFLDSLGGPDSSSGKEFLRFFANENLQDYKLRFHVSDRGHVNISEANLKNLSERFDCFHNLLTKFDDCSETKWSVPIIWHHALLEDMCKAFCLVTRTHLFNLLEDDSDLALVIQALRVTSRFEQTLVRELHRRQILGTDISKRIESKSSSNESGEKEERNVISGVLLKQSRWLLQWRHRSFVLRGRRLTVYHDCEKEIRDLLESEPDDVFALRPGTWCSSACGVWCWSACGVRARVVFERVVFERVVFEREVQILTFIIHLLIALTYITYITLEHRYCQCCC